MTEVGAIGAGSTIASKVIEWIDCALALISFKTKPLNWREMFKVSMSARKKELSIRFKHTGYHDPVPASHSLILPGEDASEFKKMLEMSSSYTSEFSPQKGPQSESDLSPAYVIHITVISRVKAGPCEGD